MRLIPYQRLNMYYKHRIAMLYNMASNLIIHERIRTTLGKAKSLAYLMNNLFRIASPMDTPARKKVKVIVRIPMAYQKLMNGLVDKYRQNMGGVVRIVKDSKVRLNDNSKMAYVELLDNKSVSNSDKYMKFLKENKNSSNFLKWEIFTRERELASYQLEKDRRQNLYNKLQKVIAECREESNQTKEKLEFLIQEKLFGDVDVHKLIMDYKIPPQHNIQFYLKARKPEEFELFFKDSDYYLAKLIRRTNKQLEYLHNIKSDSKLAEKYEKHNYLRFFGFKNNEEAIKEYNEIIEREQVFEKHNERVMLKRLDMQNKFTETNINKEIKILKAIDDHIKANKYNKFNLTNEQKNELNRIRKAEILRFELLEKAESEENLVKKIKEKNKGVAKINNYKNNEIADTQGFDLTYSQRMLLLNDREGLTEDVTDQQLNNMNKEINKQNLEKKFVNQYNKRKRVEDSLRRRKRYQLPDVKRNRTSLDKYDDEDMYHLVKSFKENGIDVKKSFRAPKNNQTTPDI